MRKETAVAYSVVLPWDSPRATKKSNASCLRYLWVEIWTPGSTAVTGSNMAAGEAVIRDGIVHATSDSPSFIVKKDVLCNLVSKLFSYEKWISSPC